GLAVCYPLHDPIDSDMAILAGGGLMVLSVIVLMLRRQQPWLLTGWLWYLGTLVPVIGLVQVGSQSMADRYTYIPAIGIFIAVIWLVAEVSLKWPQRRLILATLSIGLLTACWTSAAAQVRYWKNSETLARHALAVTVNNGPMNIMLGNTFANQG